MNRVLILLLTILYATHCYTKSSLNISPVHEEITINTENNITISGTLQQVDRSHLAIIVAGSGPTDRSGNNAQGLTTNTYQLLADSLAVHGISSFRYDKRGIGKSTPISEVDVTFHSFVRDLEAIIVHFEKAYDNIHLIGHSEGALISSLAAQDNQQVTSLTLLAGIAQPIDEVILDQLGKFPKLVPLAEQHIEEIRTGKELSEVNPFLKSIFRPSLVPFLKSVIEINPQEELSMVQQPVLIVGGACDIQVSLDQSTMQQRALSKAQLLQIDNMGHVLKGLKGDCSNQQLAYTDPDIPLHKKLVTGLVSFINNM